MPPTSEEASQPCAVHRHRRAARRRPGADRRRVDDADVGLVRRVRGEDGERRRDGLDEHLHRLPRPRPRLPHIRADDEGRGAGRQRADGGADRGGDRPIRAERLTRGRGNARVATQERDGVESLHLPAVGVPPAPGDAVAAGVATPLEIRDRPRLHVAAEVLALPHHHPRAEPASPREGGDDVRVVALRVDLHPPHHLLRDPGARKDAARGERGDVVPDDARVPAQKPLRGVAQQPTVRVRDDRQGGVPRVPSR
eukprot:gene1036-biopygen1369